MDNKEKLLKTIEKMRKTVDIPANVSDEEVLEIIENSLIGALDDFKKTLEDEIEDEIKGVPLMRNILSVPTGWKKGEPLSVQKRIVHGGQAWFIEQRPSFNFDREFTPEAISAIWFFTWDEFAQFTQWWFK